MAFDYTNLYPDTSGNGGYTKSWNYTTVVDSMAVVGAVGYFNKVATRLGIGDNIVVAQVDAFDKTRSTLIDHTELFVISIANGVVTTVAALNLASLALTGIPTAPTAAPGTNSAQIATTAFVEAARVILAAATALKADLASPALTGVPTAPNAAALTNTTQIANTAFVEAARVILAAATALKADLASPTFTGVPAVPNAAALTNTTQVANTAFVEAARVILAAATALKADLASPTFTGTPAAPNAAALTNTTQIANTAFVEAARVILAAATALKAPLASPSFTGLITAGGGQVAFPAAQVPSVDPNTLDDYEEGTGTPVLTFGGASVGITYTTQTLKYTKIGNLVFANIIMALSSKGTSVGSASVGGLPFTVADTAIIAFNMNTGPAAEVTQMTGFALAGGTAVILSRFAAGNLTTLADTDFNNGTIVRVSVTYQV